MIEVRSPRYSDVNDTNGYQKSRTAMTYNSRNGLASRTEAPGTAEAGTESYTYTIDGRLDTRTDARGNDWQTIYHACCGRTQATVDPLGHGTIVNNDYRGNVTHQATVTDVASHTNYHDPDDTKTLGEVTTRYDERGRPIARTTWLVPLGVVDPNNAPIAGLAGVPSSDGLTQRWYYDDDLNDGVGLDAGISVAKIDGSGSFTLNIASLLTELSADSTDLGATGSASADGSATVTLNGEDEISVSISDGTGRSVAQGILQQDGTPITWSTIQHDTIVNIANFGDVLETARHDALNHITRSRTDGAGRTIESVDAENFVSTYSFDAFSNLLNVDYPNSAGLSCQYDELGRRIQCADNQEESEGKNRQRTYNTAGNITGEVDADGNLTATVYDARGRKVQMTDRLSGVTQLTYDPHGNLLSLTDADDRTTAYTYDAANQKLLEQFPDHVPGTQPGDIDFGIISFTSDAAGRTLTKTDQQGDVCTYNYNLAGRLTSRVYQGGPNSPLFGQSDTDSFTYDAVGRMTSATSGRYNNVVAMGYDNASRLVSESLTAFGQTYTTTSVYDAASQKTGTTYPDGTPVDRGYTARGLLDEVSVNAMVLETRSYDAAGVLLQRALGNGQTETHTYRPDLLRATTDTPGVSSFTYSYDTNKRKKGEQIGGVMSGFGYDSGASGLDAEGHLVAWNRTDGNLDLSWALTPGGDWDSVVENGATEDRHHSVGHQLASIDSSPLTYDLKGNLTTQVDGRAFAWDFDSRLQQVSVPSGAPGKVGTHAYTYDAFGSRVSKTVAGGQTTVFVRSEEHVIAEYSSGSAPAAPLRKSIYGNYVDEPIAFIDSAQATFYCHTNDQFSVVALSDAAGHVIERYAYAPYGGVAICDSTGNLRTVQESTVGNDRLYTGRRFDYESGLYHYRARYYDATLGRFISRDPITFSGSEWNLYEYAGGAPTRFVDPTGLKCQENHFAFHLPTWNPGEKLPKLLGKLPFNMTGGGRGRDKICDEDCGCGKTAIKRKRQAEVNLNFQFTSPNMPLPSFPFVYGKISASGTVRGSMYSVKGGCDDVNIDRMCIAGLVSISGGGCVGVPPAPPVPVPGGITGLLSACLYAEVWCQGRMCTGTGGTYNNVCCGYRAYWETCFWGFCHTHVIVADDNCTP